MSHTRTVAPSHRRTIAACTMIALALAVVAFAQGQAETLAIMERAVADFEAGRVAESAAGFDLAVKAAPQVMPRLWQRGIALYYAGRYRDCRLQFEAHRTVNPDDVENPAWHFLCVAKLESPERARAALLPVGSDSRVPMREIYQMFRGTLTPEQVLEAGGTRPSAQFYARLYVGLYLEALGDTARSLQNMTIAAEDRYASAGGYMHMVARIHVRSRQTGPR